MLHLFIKNNTEELACEAMPLPYARFTVVICLGLRILSSVKKLELAVMQ